jgi:hypothetical protein
LIKKNPPCVDLCQGTLSLAAEELSSCDGPRQGTTSVVPISGFLFVVIPGRLQPPRDLLFALLRAASIASIRRSRTTRYGLCKPSLYLLLFCALCVGASAQVSSRPSPSPAEGGAQTHTSELPQPSDTHALEQGFFSLIRSGKPGKLLSYVSKGGVDVGKDAQHLTRDEVEDQINNQRGLYCKLFDSACIQSEIQLDNSKVHACSYRELLTKSKKVRTAASETTRNGVRQAILVAEVKNDNCTGVGLIDFIFNRQSDGWKLFSIP